MSGKKQQRLQRIAEERQHKAKRQRRIRVIAIATILALTTSAVV